MDHSLERLRPLVEPDHPALSVRRQCQRLGLSRSSLYYEPAAETVANLRLMRRIDQEYTAHPFLGSRRLTKWLSEHGEAVNRKRLQTAVEDNVTCCYAVQNKVWATDPDGNRWEVYVVLDNNGKQHHSTQTACCADKPDCCEDKAACCTTLPDAEGAGKASGQACVCSV